VFAVERKAISSNPDAEIDTMKSNTTPQAEKFKIAAKEVETSDDEPAFDASLKKLAKAKPQPKK
jgi:hypothetical protein